MIYEAYGVGGLTARNVDAGQPSPGERHHDQRNEWHGHWQPAGVIQVGRYCRSMLLVWTAQGTRSVIC